MSANVIPLPTAAPSRVEQTDRIVSKQVCAELLDVTVQTLDRWIRQGMPEEVPGLQEGCWRYVGHRRKFYVERSITWASSRPRLPGGRVPGSGRVDYDLVNRDGLRLKRVGLQAGEAFPPFPDQRGVGYVEV